MHHALAIFPVSNRHLSLLSALVFFIGCGMLLTMLLAYLDEGTWRAYDSFAAYLIAGDVATSDLLVWTALHVFIGMSIWLLTKHRDSFKGLRGLFVISCCLITCYVLLFSALMLVMTS